MSMQLTKQNELMPLELANSSNGSLRKITVANTEAMHKMSSKLGEVTAVRKEVSQFVQQMAVNNEAINTQLQQLVNDSINEHKFLVGEFKNLRESLSIAQQNTANVYNLLQQEVTNRKQLQKKFNEDIQLRAKKQKYLWVGIGALLVSLVCSLVYINFPTSYFHYFDKKPSKATTSNLALDDSALLPTLDKDAKDKAKVEVKTKSKSNR